MSSISFRSEALVLAVGDISFLALSLWATLLVRYTALPHTRIFLTHLVPFSFLFLFSTAVFLIAGLYEKHTLLVKSKLPETIFYAQVANVIVAAIFFFLVPHFGIQPKTNLFIYLFFSTTFVSFWRLYLFPAFSVSVPSPALLVGEGTVCADVEREVNNNNRYAVRFSGHIDTAGLPTDEVKEKILAALSEPGAFVVMPFSFMRGRGSHTWDTLMLSGVKFIDLEDLYEDLFGRVALSLIDERWFLEARSQAPAALYDIFKGFTDLLLSAFALVVLSPLIVVVVIILSAGGGNSLIFQRRVGRDGHPISIIKFRTMLFDDGEDPEKKKQNRITRFGAFLRKTQIDEIPQFWNVLTGDLSLIGPRPEIPHFVEEYARVIPYYETRHLIQPGISGWAQIKHASPPKFRLDVEATADKLSYDLYYLKHRSFLLDMEIVLRTIKILLARASR
ncbi:sugar transferase [Candidatus Kaiserbacteria bacterium]|nr:sugar transferase [Candidatus Kaiserbacteria bacterium]